MYRKIVVAVFFVLLMAGIAFAGTSDSIYERWKPGEVKGWTVYANDDDVDESAYEMITELDTTYAQLAAADTIEIVSSDASDITQTVTVYGINSAGKKASESIALDTTAGTTAVESDTTFTYIDQVEVDAECAGVITVRRATGDTFITSIPIGQLDAQMAQHFNGEYKTYITGWSARCTSTTGSIILQLRWYPDDADCLDAGDGYKVLDEIIFTNELGSDSGIMGNPILVPAGGWIAVYGIGGAANSDCSVTIQGVDVML
jgi:hypothetical protein